MNLDKILTDMLVTANYPKELHGQFIEAFYGYLFMKLITEIEGIDPASAQELKLAIQNYDSNPNQVTIVWEKLSLNPNLQPILQRVSEETFTELLSDIGSTSTEPQKAQILSSLCL